MTPPWRRHKDVLANGLRVVTVELPHLHTASLVMYARVGSRYESADDNGLSHFLEHMLFRGTLRHPDAYQINHAIEAIGGTLYAETGRDYSLYQLALHPENLAAGIALLGEIFRAPSFTRIDVERRIVLEEILEDLDERGRDVNVDDLARRSLFGDHPLAQKITGPYRNVERFAEDDVRRHFARCYGAANMVFAVSGACRRDEVMGGVAAAFAELPTGRLLEAAAPPESIGEARFHHVANQGSQTNLQLLFRALPESSPDYPALQLLSRILDDGMSTRLHRRMCDELGLAYYVSASIESFCDAALFEIDAACAHAKVPALLGEAFTLLQGLAERPAADDELAKAKRRYRWDLEASFDDPDAMAGWWGGTELFFSPSGYEEKIARIGAVGAQDVQRVARTIFRPERLAVAAVGHLDRTQQRALRRQVAAFRGALV